MNKAAMRLQCWVSYFLKVTCYCNGVTCNKLLPNTGCV